MPEGTQCRVPVAHPVHLERVIGLIEGGKIT